jgi:hypothetical protein
MNPRLALAPELGEWLRRKDDGRWAQVDHVARVGQYNPPTMMPLAEGDVIMRYGAGLTSICSGGDYFWARWERVSTTEAARIAIDVAHGRDL